MKGSIVILLIFVASVAAIRIQASTPVTVQPVFRWFEPGGEHFYTLDRNANGAEYFNIESREFCTLKTPTEGTVALNELYNPNVQRHYLTTKDDSVAFLTQNGWVSAGNIGYCFLEPKSLTVLRRGKEVQVQTVPLHEYYLPSQLDHFYTVTPGSYPGYDYYGIPCHVIPSSVC